MIPPAENPAGTKSRQPLPAWAARLVAFLLGVVVAAVANYVLYRIGISGTPFIYVSF